MIQWLEYRSTNEAVKENYGTRSIQIHYNRDENIVMFKNSASVTFSREEAIDMLKDILKTLEDE